MEQWKMKYTETHVGSYFVKRQKKRLTTWQCYNLQLTPILCCCELCSFTHISTTSTTISQLFIQLFSMLYISDIILSNGSKTLKNSNAFAPKKLNVVLNEYKDGQK